MEGGRCESRDAREPSGGHVATVVAVGLEVVADLVETDDRAGLADRQVYEVAGDLGAERGGLEVVVDDRHRHDRLDRAQPAHRLRPGHQPAAEAPGEGREDDVVDGAAVHLADPAVVGELGAHGDEAALLRQLAVDRRGVDRPAPGQGVGHLGDPATGRGRLPGERLGVGAGGRPQRPRALEGVGHRVEGDSDRSRRPARAPVVVVPQRGAVGRGVEEHLPDVHGLPSVDEDLVTLGQQGDPAHGQALDEVDLPQRAAAVERPGGDARDQLAELVHGPGPRQGRAAYVVAEVEVLVVDPGRVGEPTRHHLQPLPVARDEGDPVGD